MRQVYAHDAVLTIDRTGDARAPGGAITMALCGSWEHPPPCPLAPHHTHRDRDGAQLRLRVLFATEPEHEQHVRLLIDATLARGRTTGPDGVRAHWQLLDSGPGAVPAGERAHAGRLAAG